MFSIFCELIQSNKIVGNQFIIGWIDSQWSFTPKYGFSTFGNQLNSVLILFTLKVQLNHK